MGRFAAMIPPLTELQNYKNWIGERPGDIQRAVIHHGGWSKVFPFKVDDWANSIRNYFNVTPRFLTQIKGAPDVQKAGFWGDKGDTATALALTDEAYKDETGRYWYQMSTGALGYHYKGGATSKAGATWAYLNPQSGFPIFKLVSPDGTGGSYEVCIINYGHESTVGRLRQLNDVANRIVTDNHYQGSYNYSETVVMGFDEHDRRDIKPHKVMVLPYLDPPRWEPLNRRSLPGL